ncbi:MAG: homoserine dehydrogenase, partial [Eubacteriales bacterium]
KLLQELTSCLAANAISEITGILNGTTNYILTSMIRSGIPFEKALAEAQKLGYAEADPTADIEGHDACRKLCILSALAFGRHVNPDQVQTEWITKITLADVDYAQTKDYKIKLLGRTICQSGKQLAFVAPHLVPTDNPLAGVEDVFNAISVRGNAIGDAMFYGRGAGKLPTASAVVADIIDLARDMTTNRHNGWDEGAPDLITGNDNFPSRFYIRGTGSLDKAKAIFPTLTPLSRSGAPESEYAFLSPTTSKEQLDQELAPLNIQSIIRILE